MVVSARPLPTMQNQPSASLQRESSAFQQPKQQRTPYSRKKSTSSSTYHPPPLQLQASKPAQNESIANDAGVVDDRSSSNVQRTPSSKRRSNTTRSTGNRQSVATRSNYSGRASSASSVRTFHEQLHSLPPSLPQSPRGTSFANLPADQAREILSNLDWSGSSTKSSHSTATHAQEVGDSLLSTLETRPSPLSRMTTVTQLQTINSEQLHILPIDNSKTQASSKISSFFGWRGGNAAPAAPNHIILPTTPIAESSPTTISSDSEHSPYVRSPTTFASSVKSVPPQIDVTKANSVSIPLLSATNFTSPPSPGMAAQIDEMEEELKDLSSELAASIRREMELEDEVERIQSGAERSRRTSDYFSDSAASSVKDGAIGRDRNVEEELEKLKRRTSQEKAQLKLELAQKLEQERGKRKTLEEQVRALQGHLAELEKVSTPHGGDRLQELERRLVEERNMKQNYEDLLNALKGDLSRHQSERDNLRDEVIPQLRARVDGLEAEIAQYATLEYEHSKMQQELAVVTSAAIASAAVTSAVGTSAVGTSAIGTSAIGTSAAVTSAATSSKGNNGGLSRSTSLRKGTTRPNSVSIKSQLMTETKETLVDRVKDSEAQRDALHRALKGLLDRQKLQSRDYEKRIRILEAERDAAVDASSPRRKAYADEVKDLRHEINWLRNRAEDAAESKWQCEKNLAGLKMNLDRAEQETTSLRTLLKQNDILVPEVLPGQPETNPDANATSITLARAYKELREAQSISIAQLKENAGLDGETDAALNALLKSLNDTKAERDYHITQAEQYKAQAQSLKDIRSFQEMESQSMASQLEAGAARIQQLNSQVNSQLLSNNSLRERLGYAVTKGEREQRENAERITTLQSRLRTLEDKLVQAQSHSEDKISENEDLVRQMSKNDNPQVTRVNRVTRKTTAGANGTPGELLLLKSPIMPSTPGIKTPLGPRLLAGQQTTGQSLTEAMRTEFLEGKVAELEKALNDTDREMQEVVQRMNMAQIEVLELQSQRDEAIKKTRSLQDKVQLENANMGGLMARMVGR